MRKLVLFGEGEGDERAVPLLALKVLEGTENEYNVFVERRAWRVKGLSKLKWKLLHGTPKGSYPNLLKADTENRAIRRLLLN